MEAQNTSNTFIVQRIAVVDFDVHHGNGTQELLQGDENFMFYSIHACDERRFFYPGTGDDSHAKKPENTETVSAADGCGACGGPESEHSFSNVINVPLKRNLRRSAKLIFDSIGVYTKNYQ
jgi:hypothetical protein